MSFRQKNPRFGHQTGNRPTLVRLLHTTGFDRIVTVTDTIEEAAAFLGDDNEVAQA